MSGKKQKNNKAKTESPIGDKAPKYFADNKKTIIAEAPYNFISLPNDICEPHKMWNNPRRSTAPVMIEDENGNIKENVNATKHARETICDIYEEYIQKHGEHSGYVELKITTTRDTLVGMPTEKPGESIFFSIKNNEPMIPGSSLRGMTRNLFKIMTASGFRADEDFNERVLYYRDIASADDSSELKGEYSRNHYNDNEANILGGFLVRIRVNDGSTKWRVYRDSSLDLKAKEQPRGKTTTIDWKLFDEAIKKIENSTKLVEVSGLSCKVKVNLIGTQPSNEYTITWESKDFYTVDDTTIQAYLDDARRGKNSINLLYKQGKKDEYGVSGGALESKNLERLLGVEGVDMIAPCFFVLDQDTGKVKHFGHTKYYRIPYNYSIADRVPSNLKMQYVDFTDLVFGLKEFWGGRVYFGDARLEKNDENGILKDESKIYRDTPMESILLGGNPTSYQMYLVQKDISERVHWNHDKAEIRGVKQYWHRFKVEPYLPDKNAAIVSKLSNVVKVGNVFKGKVYFKNLTTEELGALCKVLFIATGVSNYKAIEESDDNITTRDDSRRFKIGKGKSIGLGTIDIQSMLFLERQDEYSQDDMWTENGITPLQAIPLDTGAQNVDKFISDFDAHVKSTMSNTARKYLEDGLKDLYEMMVWKGNSQSFDARTVHMSIKDPDKRFIKRTALLEPKEFKEFK